MPDPAFQPLAVLAIPKPLAKARAVPATSLPEHAPFGPIVDRQLAACRRNATSLVVLSIGLGGLEAVRECHGHAVESQLLHAIWNRLRSRLRGSDLAVRAGTAEFGAILLNAGAAIADLVDARLSEALCESYAIGAREIVISVRTGVAAYPQAGNTGDALVQAAIRARTGAAKIG
jgi:diguanylate cyclase (GGDEF)-like protein